MEGICREIDGGYKGYGGLTPTRYLLTAWSGQQRLILLTAKGKNLVLGALDSLTTLLNDQQTITSYATGQRSKRWNCLEFVS